MPVSTVHPLYMKRSFQWETMRDCVEGEDAIKAKGAVYLPRLSGDTDESYAAYKMRARFVNYTKRTLDGLHGLIFRRAPVVERPDTPRLISILDNIDKRGTALYQFVSDSVYDVMITGWGGLLADFPKTEEGTDLLSAERMGYRPYVRYYPAESIINWKHGVVNGSERLTMVVLREQWDSDEDDPFVHSFTTVYRVLILVNGVYHQWIMREGEVKVRNGIEERQPDELVEDIVVRINGRTLDYIPFETLPGKIPETPMFLDLARVNIGHYQKSADYENGVHMTTIPTGYVTGHDKYIDPVTKEEEVIELGADRFLMFKEADATVGTLVFSGVGLTHSETALSNAMSDMAILGSRLVTPEKGTSESADSAKIHRAGENARLAAFARNVSEGITRVLKTIAKWAGEDGDISISLCTDYDTLAFDPNALNSLANLADAGKMPLPYIFWNLKNGEYTPDSATLEEYVTLLNMEKAGFTPLEIVQAYRNMQLGKKYSLPGKASVPAAGAAGEPAIAEEK